jgi:UDP-N-acetylglucosamine diphosphorylase/glucosamine-1-phosphate N-acetyltransferase
MIIFDDGLGELGPMTDLRAAFSVRTGMLTTAERIAATRPEKLAGHHVPPGLAALVAQTAGAPVNRVPAAESVLCVNGRWAQPGPAGIEAGAALVEETSGHVIMAHLARGAAERFLASGELHRVAARALPGRQLYRYPWHVIEGLPGALVRDLELAPAAVHPTARVHPSAVLDEERGPVAIHEKAVIRPGAVVCGPCSIGPGSVVVDRALVKPNTVIGPMCKVGGEVGATIFQGFSNKAHDGHLGDSWVGEWVNFGAGTTNSNLLNTYGEVLCRLDPDGPVQRSGMTFLGAIVGDHVKLAICTRVMTGAVIGTGAMIASSAAAPQAVRPFAWITDRGEQRFRFEKFLATATAMMARRDRAPGAELVAALRALYGRGG